MASKMAQWPHEPASKVQQAEFNSQHPYSKSQESTPLSCPLTYTDVLCHMGMCSQVCCVVCVCVCMHVCMQSFKTSFRQTGKKLPVKTVFQRMGPRWANRFANKYSGGYSRAETHSVATFVTVLCACYYQVTVYTDVPQHQEARKEKWGWSSCHLGKKPMVSMLTACLE